MPTRAETHIQNTAPGPVSYTHLAKIVGLADRWATWIVVIALAASAPVSYTHLHPVFTMAVRDGYIRINPATGAMAEIKKSNNWEKPKRHALTKAEQAAFIDYIKSSKIYNHWLPLFTVLLGTGCRIGEVIGLRWEDCDFEDGIIRINHNMVYRKYEGESKARFHIETPKTEAGTRIVPMLEEVKEALRTEWACLLYTSRCV